MNFYVRARGLFEGIVYLFA